MDIKDLNFGAPRDFFWFRAKIDLIETLLSKLSLRGRSRILDIGAGTGDDLSAISRFGDVFALDPNQDTLALMPDSKEVLAVRGNAYSLPFADNSFDVAVAFDVLEHIEHDLKATQEVKRVLKPNGHFLITVPAFNFLYSAHDRALGHFRRYNARALRELLKGFRTIETGYWMFSLFPLMAFQRFISKNEGDVAIRYPRLPRTINELLYRTLRLENRLIYKGFHFPFGSTIYAICQS